MGEDPHNTDHIREHQWGKEEATTGSPDEPLTLDDIPPDAPMEDGIILGCWDGEAFVSWGKWIDSRLVEVFREAPREIPPAPKQQSTPAQPSKTRSHCTFTASLFD